VRNRLLDKKIASGEIVGGPSCVLVGTPRLCQGYAGQAGHCFETNTSPVRPFMNAFSAPSEPYLLTAARAWPPTG